MILHWTADPVLLRLGGFELRYYGLLFAAGFYIASVAFQKIFAQEGKEPKDVDALLGYMIVGVLVGARLGHTLFYEPGYYLSHPVEILKVWKGGLASHGGVLGVFAAGWLFCRRRGYSFLWLIDRAAIWASLGGALIRLGNFFNSEIIGTPTDGNWGVVFGRINQTPRHPAQLYESVCYLLIFLVSHWVYKHSKSKDFQGRIFGGAMLAVFAARALVETVKAPQTAITLGWGLSMGQALSLPFIALALFLVLRRRNNA